MMSTFGTLDCVQRTCQRMKEGGGVGKLKTLCCLQSVSRASLHRTSTVQLSFFSKEIDKNNLGKEEKIQMCN